MMSAVGLLGQVAPPLQYYVTDIVAAPLKPSSPTAFEAGPAFTMEGWIFLTRHYPRSWIMGKALPINGGAGGMALNYSLQLDDTGTSVRFVTDTYGLVAPGTLPLRTWTHVAVTLENGTARLLVNGVVVATRTSAPAIPAAPTLPFGVGAAFDAAGNPAVGEPTHLFARQLRFWAVARSPDQIVAAMGETIPSSRAGLVAAWPLDESGGTTLRDLSGGGRHLTKSDFIGAIRRTVLEGGPFFSGSFMDVPRSVMSDPSSSTVIDFDSDGDLDLILQQAITPQVFPAVSRRQLAFRNNGGTFVEATDAVLGNVQMDSPYRSWVADFNRDGRTDLFIADTGADTLEAPGAQSRLFIQSADGRLVDESATRLPQRSSYTHDIAVGDVDRDGDLDIYMVNQIRDTPRLYINNGSGFFSDPGGRVPADVASGFTENPGAVFVDVNVDGWPDLVLGGIYYAPNGANSTRPNLLLMNDRTGRFVSDPAFTIPPKLHGIEGVSPRIFTADFDGNGAPDILMSTDRGAVDPGLQLLLNDGTGRLRDASAQLNLTFPQTDNWVVGLHIVDLNFDGRPDIVMRTNSTTFNQATYARSILLNRGGGVFVDASEVLLANSILGLSVGDWDRDGLLDLLMPYHERIYFYRGTKLLDLSLFADVAPVITTQPASQVVAVGSTLELVATAAGSPLPTLQWRKNGVAIPGATNPILTIPNATGADTGSYTVVATNVAGTTTSTAAFVPPLSVVAGGTASFRATAGGAGAAYQWSWNGTTIASGTASTLTVTNVQPTQAGIYSVAIAGGGSTTQEHSILGLDTTAKVIGTASEVGPNIRHQNGNFYDQLLLEGVAATFTADATQVTRLSFIDLSNDIVQVEFSGPGTVSVVLDGHTGPAAPVNYNQALGYMKGHAGIVVTGATEASHLSVFSVGRANAVNQALFRNDVAYDGVADIAFVAIASSNGKFGGLRTANVGYWSTKGVTGVYAVGVEFTGPVFVGDITASENAMPVLMIGAGATTQVNGGDFLQTNGRAVQVSGLTQLRFVPGSTSHGDPIVAKTNRGRLEQNGLEVTSQVTVNP